MQPGRHVEEAGVRYWTTDDRPAREQFSYWREVICEAFTPLAAERPRVRHAGPADPGAIRSWVRATRLTATNCAEVSSATQLITHGRDEIRRTTTDHVFVNLQVSGHCVGTQAGRRCVVEPGGFALFDTTREYGLEFVADDDTQDWRCVSFRVPRAQLVPLVADLDGATAVTHDGAAPGIARVVASIMLATWNAVDTFDPAAAAAAETAFTTLLAAATGGSEELRDTGREHLDAGLRAAVNRHLAAHLRTGDTSAAAVAARFGISVRKLHQLYEGTGRSFARTVMALRVDGCTRELGAPGPTGTLTELAARWGFADLSHLNRVFRARHGCLPSEFRDRGPAGSCTPVPAGVRAGSILGPGVPATLHPSP
ncbi:helix-turn-helix domain-containing protein [Pseudonocardia sp. ICBG601]|uniref:helix-turn-helix domain-containing protein n=1 Tax=Pseudonocardia sp. ICBG601 TaxID=2846759 RepID=UPI001CF663E8|nr:helix-turn-helix domain-containing protein [Pseudonocardia sp. ICBG601]